MICSKHLNISCNKSSELLGVNKHRSGCKQAPWCVRRMVSAGYYKCLTVLSSSFTTLSGRGGLSWISTESLSSNLSSSCSTCQSRSQCSKARKKLWLRFLMLIVVSVYQRPPRNLQSRFLKFLSVFFPPVVLWYVISKAELCFLFFLLCSNLITYWFLRLCSLRLFSDIKRHFKHSNN